MTRLLSSKIGPAAPEGLFNSQPWISSGVLTASTVIKAKAGVLGGIDVIASDNGGDINVIVWDSPTATTTSDVELTRVTIETTTDHASKSHRAPSQVGIQAEFGIYVQLVAGDCEIIVYYR
jgi:hypothetical protein